MDLSLRRLRASVKYRWEQWVWLDPAYLEPLVSLLALMPPQQARGLTKRRIGASRDGGYVMLDDFAGIEAAISLGVGPDVSWDFAVAEKGIPVWQYDHTVEGPPQKHPLFHFNKQRVVARDPSPGDVSFVSLLAPHAGKPLLLKIDIEGDEWKIFAGASPDLLRDCRQIVIELHDFRCITDPDWVRHARGILNYLARDFGVVHVHGNNLSKNLVLGTRRFPDYLEVTFANRRFYDLSPANENFPGRYDRKNNLFFLDFHLGRFQFDAPGKP